MTCRIGAITVGEMPELVLSVEDISPPGPGPDPTPGPGGTGDEAGGAGVPPGTIESSAGYVSGVSLDTGDGGGVIAGCGEDTGILVGTGDGCNGGVLLGASTPGGGSEIISCPPDIGENKKSPARKKMTDRKKMSLALDILEVFCLYFNFILTMNFKTMCIFCQLKTGQISRIEQ